MRSLPICAMTQGYEERQMAIANDVVPRSIFFGEQL
jgi:hypothetical protein